MNQIDQIIAFEDGELDLDQTLDLFVGLLNSGLAWQLQGFYGRTATALLEAGHIARINVGPRTGEYVKVTDRIDGRVIEAAPQLTEGE